MLWAIFALLAAIIYAFTNILDKYIMTAHLRNPIVPTIITGFVGFGIASLLAIPHFSVPDLPILLLLVFAGIIYQGANFLYFKAVITEEVSRVIPVILIEPLFVLMFASVFLGEAFFPLQYLGIFLLVGGSIFISLRKREKFEFSSVLGLALLSSLLYAADTAIVKYALASVDFWNAFFWVRAGLIIASLFLLVFNFSEFKSTVRRAKKASFYSAISESLVALASLVFYVAMSLGAVSLVSALGATQPFFVLLFATIVTLVKPKYVAEEIRKTTLLQKVIAISMIVIGSILLF